MPNRLSLVRRVAEVRRIYTGEYDSDLLPTVVAGLQTLTATERATIDDALECGFETRLLGEGNFPRVTEKLRRAVVSDAIGKAQKQLEAAALLAMGQISSYCPPQSLGEAPFVHPTVDGGMVLHLSPTKAAPVIATMVPYVADGSLRGLAGFRVRAYRRHIRLQFADCLPSISVSLANTDFRHWSAIRAFVYEQSGYQWSTIDDAPLTGHEIAAIEAGRTPGVDSLTSSLFRRLRVFGVPSWLTISLHGSAGLDVEWAGGRSAAEVATALVHPLAGLPGKRFIAKWYSPKRITVDIFGAEQEKSQASIFLHRVPLGVKSPLDRIDASDAWAAFRHTLTLPRPDSAPDKRRLNVK